VSDVAWNPDQGLHVVTASGEDKNPVLKLWDLRSSTSLPLATLQGHSEGILSVSWCPADTSLLLSCGKDNRTILWDLFHLQPVYELASTSQGVSGGGGLSAMGGSDSDQSVFGGFASSAGQRRHHVAWSPCVPAVVSACSFDRKVQFFSLSGARSKIGRAPKWLRRPIGAAFGFGGKLVSFDGLHAASASAAAAAGGAAAAGKKGSAGSVQLKVLQVLEDPLLVQASDAFHEVVNSKEYKQFCETKTYAIESSEQERQVWGLMKVICFCSNAREELLTHLGFDSGFISQVAEKYVQSLSHSSSSTVSSSAATATALDVFGDHAGSVPEPDPLALTHMSPAVALHTAEMIASAQKAEQAEPVIRKAIIVGNFEAAVDLCLQAGLLAEALLLAQCGDQALRVKTQAAFFDKQRRQRPFLNVLHAVIKSELMSYVQQSELSEWKETLALLSTYGKSDEFPLLCEALATRLENELGDYNSATLCFMCAANVARTVGFWTQELQRANAVRGQLDTQALQNYVEKVTVFTHANPVESLGPECTGFIARYAELLANQGRLEVALSYVQQGDSDLQQRILLDRLFHAGSRTKAGTAATVAKPPAFPFTRTVVEPFNPTASTAASAAPAAAASGVSKGTQGTHTQQQQRHPALVAAAKTTQAAATAVHASSATSSAFTAAPVAATTSTAAGVGGLPAGWIQLIDPTSGHPYYVNQATNQSQWEPPLPVVAPVPAAVEPQQYQQPQQQQFLQQQQQQQQQFAQQQQQQQPMQRSQFQPSIQPTVAVPTPSQPAVSPAAAAAVSEPSPSEPLSVDASCVVELGQLLEALASVITVPAEKRQLDMLRASYANLMEKVAANQVAGDVMIKLAKFVEFVTYRNYPAASAVQTDLVNTAWGQHKEWIKGLKILVQLAAKK